MNTPKLPPLPERDTSKPAEQQGLFRKFDVRRTDGSSEPGRKHHGCEYFVLDVYHDPAARAALKAYADAVEAPHPLLAADMRERYAIAAIQAQGVPDGVVLQIDAAVVQQEPLSREEREVVVRSIRDGCDLIHAGVMQQEPFAYYQPECHQNIMEAKWRDREASRSDTSTMIAYAKACTEPLYTRPAQQTAAVQQDRMVFCTYPSCHGEGKTCTGPCATQPIQKAAQQAKPQPLSDEQVDQLYEAAVKARKFVTRQDFELGIRHAEAAHGIKE